MPPPQLTGAQFTLIRQHLDHLDSPYADDPSPTVRNMVELARRLVATMRLGSARARG